MKSFLDKRDPWGHGYSMWIVVAMVFFSPLMFNALKGIRLSNNVETWLPDDDPEARVFAWSREMFPHKEKIIVSWEGGTLNDKRVDAFSSQLLGSPSEDGIVRNGNPLIANVLTPQQTVDRMVELNVEEEEAIQRIKGLMVGTGRMKIRLTEEGRNHARQSIEEVVEHFQSQTGISATIHSPVVDVSEDDLVVEIEDAEWSEEAADAEAKQYVFELAEYDFGVSWTGLQPGSDMAKKFRDMAMAYRTRPSAKVPHAEQLVEDCFFSVGSPIGVIVELSEAGAADPNSASQAIRDAALAAGVPVEDLHLGGSSITTGELNDAVRRSGWNTDAKWYMIHKRSIMGLSGAIGILLAFIFLRSLRLGMLVVGVAYYATTISIALIPLSGGTMNMVLVVMPTLLLVLSLSSAIHVANYWKHSAVDSEKGAVQRALAMAKQPCILAAVTTAIGLASLASSTLRPVRAFGIYSAIGCIIALVVVLYGLPALLQISSPKPPAPKESNAAGWQSFGIGIYRWSTLTSLTFLTVSAVAIFGLSYFQTETKVVSYFPEDSRLTRDYTFLEDNLTGIAPIDVFVRFDQESQDSTTFLDRMETVRGVSNVLRANREVKGAISLADFQPVSQAPDEGASRLAKIKYMRRAQAAEIRVRGGEEAAAAQFMKLVEADTDVVGKDGEPVAKAGDEIWKITAHAGIMTDTSYADLTDELNASIAQSLNGRPGTSHIVTGAVPLFLRTQEAVLESLIVSFGLAFGLIACMMIYVVKDVWAGLLAMIPNIIPVVTVFGLLSWAGQKVDVGSMITASVALGIAVDGTLHLITWFRDGLERGMSRMRAVVEALTHCAPALWQTSTAVGVGLFILYPAELLLISRFGWLMAALIAAALAADLILLPSLLSGWLGALIERKIVRRPAEANDDSPTTFRPNPPHISLSASIKKAREAG